MRIDAGYPSPGELRKNELKTLQHIKDNIVFQTYYSTLATDAYNSFPRLQNAASLNFASSFRICLNRGSGKIGLAHIGLIIRTKDDRYDQVSYSLAICSETRGRYRLLRSFHFDYALPGDVSRQPHPVFHLQYAGALFGQLNILKIQHAHLDSWLSEPRLLSMPMSLALLINIVFKEFPDGNSVKVIERGEWRDLIRKNEKLLLVPYFKSCHNFMNAINNFGKLLTNDFYYGN
jgi:hypothetical protein